MAAAAAAQPIVIRALGVFQRRYEKKSWTLQLLNDPAGVNLSIVETPPGTHYWRFSHQYNGASPTHIVALRGKGLPFGVPYHTKGTYHVNHPWVLDDSTCVVDCFMVAAKFILHAYRGANTNQQQNQLGVIPSLVSEARNWGEIHNQNLWSDESWDRLSQIHLKELKRALWYAVATNEANVHHPAPVGDRQHIQVFRTFLAMFEEAQELGISTQLCCYCDYCDGYYPDTSPGAQPPWQTFDHTILYPTNQRSVFIGNSMATSAMTRLIEGFFNTMDHVTEPQATGNCPQCNNNDPMEAYALRAIPRAGNHIAVGIPTPTHRRLKSKVAVSDHIILMPDATRPVEPSGFYPMKALAFHWRGGLYSNGRHARLYFEDEDHAGNLVPNRLQMYDPHMPLDNNGNFTNAGVRIGDLRYRGGEKVPSPWRRHPVIMFFEMLDPAPGVTAATELRRRQRRATSNPSANMPRPGFHFPPRGVFFTRLGGAGDPTSMHGPDKTSATESVKSTSPEEPRRSSRIAERKERQKAEGKEAPGSRKRSYSS